MLTASHLYDYLQCPHKVWRDLYGPKDEKIEEKNPFVELLWQKGMQHEENVVAGLGEFEDIATGSLEERAEKTLEAMKQGSDLIYQGVIEADGMRGIPDLLRRLPDGMYMPVDIKSGMAFEGADEENGEEGKPKKHYAVQLCLYIDILQRLGFAKERVGKILDGHGEESLYALEAARGKRTPETYWECYERLKAEIIPLMENRDSNKPAMKGVCKLCPWYASCKKWCEKNDDMTLLFYLGRSNRDVLSEDVSIDTMHDVLGMDIDDLMERKKRDGVLKGMAQKSLEKFKRRAEVMLEGKKPVLYEPVYFPEVGYELFFDIEDDPTQEFVYLHGVYERGPKGERFLDFTATELTPEAEKEAWSRFWEYIRSLPQDDFAVYYYAHHEKTTYRKLQKLYPEVIPEEELEEFFEKEEVIDLYTSLIQNKTDWPLGSYSLKAIATYLGFKWRDETPSGALSIQWFNEYLEKKDPAMLNRILEYNEDDCRATMVVKDALVEMQKKRS